MRELFCDIGKKGGRRRIFFSFFVDCGKRVEEKILLFTYYSLHSYLPRRSNTKSTPSHAYLSLYTDIVTFSWISDGARGSGDELKHVRIILDFSMAPWIRRYQYYSDMFKKVYLGSGVFPPSKFTKASIIGGINNWRMRIGHF